MHIPPESNLPLIQALTSIWDSVSISDSYSSPYLFIDWFIYLFSARTLWTREWSSKKKQGRALHLLPRAKHLKVERQPKTEPTNQSYTQLDTVWPSPVVQFYVLFSCYVHQMIRPCKVNLLEKKAHCNYYWSWRIIFFWHICVSFFYFLTTPVNDLAHF